MFKILVFTIFSLFLRFSGSKLVGFCNQCLGSNKVACVDENHFSICIQGSPTATITKCPDKYVCTYDERICRPSAEGYVPICYNEYCGECEITNGTFACIDDTTYGYCFGRNTPLASTLRSCPAGFVCSHNHRAVCMPEETNVASCPVNTTTTQISSLPTDLPAKETTLITASVSSSDEQATIPMYTETKTTTVKETEIATTTTTTVALSSLTATAKTTTTQETSPITKTTAKPGTLDAKTLCGRIRRTGYFKSADATCRQYVFCYPLSGQYLGWFYYCDFYFNDATQKCQEERPKNCVVY